MHPVRPILDSARMAAAERSAIAAGSPVESLMERAGAGLAEALERFAGRGPVLILAGPGNNGGDGYVAARRLAEKGFEVRIAAFASPASAAAAAAAEKWRGPVETLSKDTQPSPVLVDALFGTGLTRGLEDKLAAALDRLCAAARLRIACDLPSGIDADSGAELSKVPDFDMSVALGALKPAHRLAPGIHKCGRVVLADIGIAADCDWFEIACPILPPIDPDAHKYSRGLVHALAGTMPGAIALAASAAARCGAGYVRVSTSRPIEGLPRAVVQLGSAEVNDPRIGCLLVGPGLGDAAQVLTLALTARAPKVIDADAISHLGEPERLRGQDCVVTPHEGEFEALFGAIEGSKAERALAAARHSQAVILFKGPDTIIAAPDGRVGFAPPAPAWLATAGTGDVLAGMVAALRARRMDAFDAACAAAWLHGQAARLAGPAMIADDLLAAIPASLALAGDA